MLASCVVAADSAHGARGRRGVIRRRAARGRCRRRGGRRRSRLGRLGAGRSQRRLARQLTADRDLRHDGCRGLCDGRVRQREDRRQRVLFGHARRRVVRLPFDGFGRSECRETLVGRRRHGSRVCGRDSRLARDGQRAGEAEDGRVGGDRVRGDWRHWVQIVHHFLLEERDLTVARGSARGRVHRRGRRRGGNRERAARKRRVLAGQILELKVHALRRGHRGAISRRVRFHERRQRGRARRRLSA